MKEGLLCPYCQLRIPLVEYGEHEVTEHDMTGFNSRSLTLLVNGDNPTSNKRVTSDQEKGKADVHDPERIVGGTFRKRPWTRGYYATSS